MGLRINQLRCVRGGSAHSKRVAAEVAGVSAKYAEATVRFEKILCMLKCALCSLPSLGRDTVSDLLSDLIRCIIMQCGKAGALASRKVHNKFTKRCGRHNTSAIDERKQMRHTASTSSSLISSSCLRRSTIAACIVCIHHLANKKKLIKKGMEGDQDSTT